MANILCVLYDDPIDGYPPSYARDEIPEIERYHDGQGTPTPGGVGFTPGVANAATGLRISSESYETVGGWVLDLFGRVPRRAERAETSELSVTVEKVERTRIVEVLVSLKKPASREVAA